MSLSISVHKAPYIHEVYTIKNDKEEIREGEGASERESEGEKGKLEELEGRLSYIGRRSRVCITRE